MTTSSHRVKIDWMGHRIETLADLLRPCLHAVCIGINPAPVSVRAGHYYQGKLGQRIFQRLRTSGLIGTSKDAWEDDVAFEAGVGFTDIVKRPTTSAVGIPLPEFTYGKALLEQKLHDVKPKLIIFTFKRVAEVFFGRIPGSGLLTGHCIAGIPSFVMPGPYEKREIASDVLGKLATLIGSRTGSDITR